MTLDLHGSMCKAKIKKHEPSSFLIQIKCCGMDSRTSNLRKKQRLSKAKGRGMWHAWFSFLGMQLQLSCCVATPFGSAGQQSVGGFGSMFLPNSFQQSLHGSVSSIILEKIESL
jgi:hypothetical protein